jgi:para-nitrobenzyl esterase
MPRFRAIVLGTVLALVTSLALTNPAGAGGDPAVVVTDKGAVRGTVTAEGREFHRIPYAAPPVGALRWRAPQAPTAWSGVRDATAPGPACAQPASPGEGTEGSTAEDCLHLNVYTPPAGAGHRPVMVWFHGGSYLTGTANHYDGSALARQGVVVVTVNYRLGAFGYLAHPALSGGSGNYGTLDQQAALRWVQANARAFGGDPRRVTAFGESAGAGSVCAQLTSPGAAGLFHRAILQSGPCAYTTRADAEAIGRQFTSAAGCQDSTDVPACLRARPAAIVLEAMDAVAPDGLALAWAPTAGTPVLPSAPDRAIEAGAYHRMPVMTGTTLDEGRIFAAFIEQGLQLDETTYPAVLADIFGPDAARVQERYTASAYGGRHDLAMGAVFTDFVFACPTWTFNRAAAASTRVFGYEFADRTAPNVFAVEPDFPLGAYHGAELSYLFRMLPLDPAQTRLSEQMLSYWTRFATAGNPNGKGTPAWPPFRHTAPAVLTLDQPPRIAHGYDFGKRHHCDFWSTVDGAGVTASRAVTRIG